MNKTLFVTVLVLLSTFAFSQELIIVVAPFEVRAGSGFSKDDVETIEYLLLNELSKSKTLKVLDQSDTMFKETINRMNFELSDWSNPKKVSDFGKALNANAVVLGRIMTLGDELIIAVRINDLNTEIKAANDMVVTKVSEVRGKLPAFTAEIVERLPKPPPPPFKTYKIGDKGPGGGYIFFVNGRNYMECSPNIGKFSQSRAEELASSYQGGGFNDWYLPSQEELDLIYMNLKRNGKGSFSNSEYWSSDMGKNYKLGITIDFGNGTIHDRNESSSYNVRAIREFYE